ncbi:MAG TPA: hypothetical protein DCQ26_08460 [Marinilabiliales bacterium]|nr:MAG: hypothetical protein A2W96_09335 [Bacteroidetes bacterium GWD2_40_43]OFX94969.1 MAG: hypothetical protein A2W97_16505 [Bacteroidetes bacterium GWE2_40_63]OFY23481.1 MAG: hypothetical protein A2W88_08320 [Bacteroidetes bacterium GWF2_40_13]OFZ29393.1 MAG: hypothetical protein A2437_09280 [Bacteroidetes bacterium RIFOXYC2_FULL_40_12]HAB52716.1 hypothetical protein [Ignavibacteriales bacterium]HAM98631.1 hypothetical protein [Marinilabiliales bacterium]
MELLTTVWIFLKAVLLSTFVQLIAIFGIFFIFGLLLYLLARFTRVTFVKSVGYKFDIFITGWLGTPVHELGHALFCLPFGHQVTEIKLYTPSSEDGTLGYVNHSYNPKNIWHRIGNFFIGMGPILFGSFVLFLLIKYLLPDNHSLLQVINSQAADLTTWQGFGNLFIQLYQVGIHFPGLLFSSSNIHSWQFWVFLYVSLSVASHMELSPPDLKGVWVGLLSIVILLFVINCISHFFGVNVSGYMFSVARFTNLSVGIFTFATALSVLFFLGSWLLLNIYTLIVHREAFHPFA